MSGTPERTSAIALTERLTAPLCLTSSLPLGDRVPASGDGFAELGSEDPSLGTWNGIDATEPGFPLSAVLFVHERPAFRAGLIDPQIEVAAIGVTPRL